MIIITTSGLMFTNFVAYSILAYILQKFFRDHYNNRFDSSVKPVLTIGYVKLLQTIITISNLSVLLYLNAKNTIKHNPDGIYWDVQETLMPYIGILLPCFIIFR